MYAAVEVVDNLPYIIAIGNRDAMIECGKKILEELDYLEKYVDEFVKNGNCITNDDPPYSISVVELP